MPICLSGHEHNYDDVRCAEFGLWQGARREHIPKWICDRRAQRSHRPNSAQPFRGSGRSEQRCLAEKKLPPEGLGRIWPVAALCSSVTDPLRDMLPPRALPQAKFSATNVIVVMFMTT